MAKGANLIYAQVDRSGPHVLRPSTNPEEVQRRNILSAGQLQAYIPLGLLLVGVGTWIEWADYEVSYPLGTAIVGSNRPSDVYGICNRTRRSTSVS